MSYRTFLLDKDNKVIAIGNPVINQKIKELIDDCFFLVTAADIQEIVNSKVASFEACQPGSEKLDNLLDSLDLQRKDIQAAMIFKTGEETQLPEKYAKHMKDR